ncbi:MAG: hypothetical protein JNJ58_03080 [Chitinophagaceae bacterium]|nr:hypothetical protein [Chitinophagaceae bacterium]
MKKIIFLSILFLLLFAAGYIYWFYYNSFSDGSREGILYKFSRKGNIFKTYEGEMIQPGLRSIQGGTINTNNFYFSVTDISLADSLEKVLGKTIKVHYIQYRKNLPWRGENYNGKNQENGQYIIDRIESVSTSSYNNPL